MNFVNKTRRMQSYRISVRRLPQAFIQTMSLAWATIALIILLIPQPGITVAPGGCTSTSGECSTSIDA